MRKNDLYSPNTRVSLQLPLGWTRLHETKDSILYFYNKNGEDPYESTDPIVKINLFGVTKSEKTIQSATEAFLNEIEQYELISELNTTVDSFRAIEYKLEYIHNQIKAEVFHQNTIVHIDDVLFNFAMICKLTVRNDFELIFKEAIKSVRFII